MKKVILLSISALALLLASCSDSEVKSLQPFYTDNNLVVKKGIEGDWLIDDKNSPSIVRITPISYRRDSTTIVNAYKLTPLPIDKIYHNDKSGIRNPLKRIKGRYTLFVRNDKNKGKIVTANSEDEKPILAHLFKLNDQTYYFDLTRFSDNGNADYTIGIHGIAKLFLYKNTIIFQSPSTDFFNKSIKKKMVKIPLLQIGEVASNGVYETKTVLTAEPQKLQKFIIKYDRQLFDSTCFGFPMIRIVYR